MNWITILGIIIIAIGTTLTYIGSSKSSTQDKKEITSKIEEFKKELESAKLDNTDSSRIDKINSVTKDFTNWADSFENNKQILKVEIDKSNIAIQEREAYLNKEWHKVYQDFFTAIKEIILAYNKASKKHQISILTDIPFPENIFEAYASKYYIHIKFDNSHYWTVLLVVREPIQEYIIPGININTSTENSVITSRLGDLSIRPDIQQNKIRVTADGIFEKANFKNDYPLSKESKILIELFKQALEYQILTL